MQRRISELHALLHQAVQDSWLHLARTSRLLSYRSAWRLCPAQCLRWVTEPTKAMPVCWLLQNWWDNILVGYMPIEANFIHFMATLFFVQVAESTGVVDPAEILQFVSTTWAPEVLRLYHPSSNIIAEYLAGLLTKIQHLEVFEVCCNWSPLQSTVMFECHCHLYKCIPLLTCRFWDSSVPMWLEMVAYK